MIGVFYNLYGILAEHWLLVLLGLLALVTARVFGSQAMLGVIVLATGLWAYRLGKKRERDTQSRKAKAIQNQREKAYEAIDARGTATDDVLGRLHQRDY